MNKSIAFTLGILLVLVALFVFLGDPKRSTVPEDETEGFAEFKRVDFDDVERITIAKGKGDPVELEEDGGSWVVASLWNYPADDKKVEGMLEALEEIDEGERRGETAASHRDFEVDKRKGSFIHLYGGEGKKLGELIVGKRAHSADFTENRVFVRANGEETTYSVKSDIQSQASLYSDDIEAKSYLKKELFKLEDEGEEREILRVRLVRDGEDDLVVERRYRIKEETEEPEEGSEEGSEDDGSTEEEKEPEKEEYFVVTKGTETFEVGDSEKYKARGLVDRARTIRVDDAAEPGKFEEYGLESPQLMAVVSHRVKGDESGDSTERISLVFGNAYKNDKGEDQGYYFALRDGGMGDRIYKVRKWDFEGWDKKLEDFLPEPEEPSEKKAEGTPEATGEPSEEGTPEATGGPSGEGTPEATGEPSEEGTPEAAAEPPESAEEPATTESSDDTTSDPVEPPTSSASRKP